MMHMYHSVNVSIVFEMLMLKNHLGLYSYLGQFGMCLIEIEFGVQKIAARLIPKPGFPRCLCKIEIKLF